jgi:hypothetical protein
MLHAYRLRAEYEDLDPDTTISLVDGIAFGVGRAFADAPDGVVVLDDTDPEQLAQIHALEGYPAVKTTSVPEPARKAASKASKED